MPFENHIALIDNLAEEVLVERVDLGGAGVAWTVWMPGNGTWMGGDKDEAEAFAAGVRTGLQWAVSELEKRRAG